ncbi:D-amino acid dehydrogenase [Sphingomonadales bacterium 56]|uniref:D-amino acid dehydrogenase n=1 Tax=unclassified Sphingobium TaxID=2611147 RepID=UPI001918A052|nr:MULTISPECIES: D-amino acid dehydrogenase [unclassified Sphingobium]MBY2928372.1 D-amino acid dehydrogenase [Sphingomonadales bacterium 56]MBY2958472.1 D-amino acid dehydrogenase [Sphingomonadales bacterium 58]CAD7337120.1 D-amino acid dehydrogenase 1 [Sphingobium sp. S6]CAD7337177.1 D-amino acid dehydrogenase 1 [Sphingobium sp. S8]
MKVAILGSGVIGVTSAWYLAKAGHEVVVIDRQSGPALETSFANAGEISPGYASPWAAPGIPMKAMRWLFMQHAPLILRPTFDAAMLRWIVAMLGNCTEKAYAVNKSRMVRLAEFSRDQLIALRQETGISYDERSQGTLQLFREQKQLDGIGKDVAVLQADGVPFEILDKAGCIAAEPGLANSQSPIVGGLRLPNDETGDCFKFTNALADMAKAAGVTFLHDHKIKRLVQGKGSIDHVETDKGPVDADAFIIALGSYSPLLVAPLGIKLPVYPVKGYSITVPITAAERAPVSTLLDESFKVAITCLGDRIRVGGMAELSGFSTNLPGKRRDTLEYSVGSLFPAAGDLGKASFWSGLRPMTPDSTPVIGSTHIPNLYLNTGHGTLGWTMACGSGHVIADIVSNRKPAIETGDLSIARYR